MTELIQSYLRRKQWEFRAQAVAIANVLGEVMGGRSGENYTAGYKEISTDAMFERIGFN